MPLVSVVIPIYNAESYLPQAMDSLLEQTYIDWDAWLIDDGSTDRSSDIIEKYARKDNRVRGMLQTNQGTSAALNVGLEVAMGRYVACMHADDMMDPRRLEIQVGQMEADPAIVICGSGYYTIDPEGVKGMIQSPPHTDTAIRWEALFHCPFAHPSVMLRLDTIHEHRLRYSPDTVVEDYDLWTRLLPLGKGINITEPLLYYRIHPDQASQVKATKMSMHAGKVSQAQLERLGIHLPMEQVQMLRAWYQRFPERLDDDHEPIVLALLETLERFGRLPEIDRGIYQVIRGRWLTRLMLTSRGGLRSSWRKYIHRHDWGMIAGYLNHRIFRPEYLRSL